MADVQEGRREKDREREMRGSGEGERVGPSEGEKKSYTL